MLGQGQKDVGDLGFGVLAYTVGKGSGPQENIGMGRKGARGMSEGPLKKDSLGGQSVDRGSPDIFRAVAAQPVGAKRIDRDEKQVEIRSCGIGGLRQQSCGENEKAREQRSKTYYQRYFFSRFYSRRARCTKYIYAYRICHCYP